MMIRNKRKITTKKAFSILEVVLGLFVLTAGIMATVILTTRSIVEVNDSRDSLIVTALAQEGVELARNVRDNAAMRLYESVNLDDTADFDGIFDHFDPTCFYDAPEIQAYAGSWSANANCAGTALIKIRDGFYVQGGAGGTDTEFRRQLRFTQDGPDRYAVKSVVTWNNTAIPSNIANCKISKHCVFVESTLTKWILHN